MEKPIDWALDAGGRGMIVELIRQRRIEIVLEIGVFLGGSVRQWLAAAPEVLVVALDPWIGGPEVEKFARECRQPEWVGRQLAAHSDAIYHTFLTNLWDERQRVVPIRSTSWEALDRLAAAGLCPGLVYLDADKSGGEMEICRRLFPDALLAGDDWFWTPCPESHRTKDSDYPIRRPVRDFCERHGGHLVVDGSTWVILDRRPSWKHRFVIAPRYHLKRFGRRTRLTVKHWMSGERAA